MAENFTISIGDYGLWVGGAGDWTLFRDTYKTGLVSCSVSPTIKRTSGSNTSVSVKYVFECTTSGSSTTITRTDKIPIGDVVTVPPLFVSIPYTLTGNITFKISATIGGVTKSATKTIPSSQTLLANLVKPSSISISPTTVAYNATTNITISQSASSNVAFTLQYLDGSTWKAISTKQTAKTKAWTVPLSLANSLTSSPMKTTIRCITYHYFPAEPEFGEPERYVEVNTTTAQLTLSSVDALKPTITVTLKDTETTVYNKFDGYVQNKSKLKVTVATSLKYSAKWSSGNVVTNGQTLPLTSASSNVTTDYLKTKGSNTVKTTVKDSRGNSVSSTQSITVYEQYNPIVTVATTRCDQSGTPSQDGAYIKATYSVDIPPINNRNDKSFRVYYKAAGQSNYTSVEIILTEYKTTNATYIFPADTEKTYQVYVEAQDYFTTVKSTEQTVPSVFVLMDFHHSGTGMSIGKVAELENRLDVGLTAILRNGIYSNLGWITLSNVGTPNAFETVYFRNDGVNNGGTYIRAYDIDEYGSAMVIRSGGPLLLGGGEYSTNRYGLDHPTGEDTYIGADGTVYIEPNGNSIANRKTWSFNTDGTLSSPNSKVELGTATTENIGIWGNSTNKIGVGVRNTQDNKRYNLLARDNYFGLENNTDSTWCWYISRDGTNRLRIQEDTHSFHVRDGMIGLYSQTDAGWTWQISGLSGTTNLGAIGTTYEKTASTSLASGTAKNLTSQSFAVGTWLVTGTAEFPANATGRRAVQLAETSGGEALSTQSRSLVAPVNGGPTVAQFTFVLEVTATKTYYLVGYQNSGSSLSTTGVINAVRIK